MNKPKTSKDEFTVTEVGTILESIHKEIKTIGEGHSDLDRRLEKVEIEVHELVEKFPIIEISNRVLHDKASRFEMALSKFNKDLKNEITEAKTELKNEMGEMRSDLKNEIGGVKTDIKKLETEVKKEIRDLGDRLTKIESAS